MKQFVTKAVQQMTEPEELFYGQDVIDDLTDDRNLWKARALEAKARVLKLETVILEVTKAVHNKLQYSLLESGIELWP